MRVVALGRLGVSCRRRRRSRRRATCCTSRSPPTRSTDFDAALRRRPGQRRGRTDEGHHRRRRQRRALHRPGAAGRGHDVTIIDNDRDVVARPADGRPGRGALDRRRCLRPRHADRSRAGRGRRRRGGHRRRRGQPRRLAAGQAGVRRATRRRPGQQPEERVDVQRDVGRRRRRVDAAPDHRPGPGGGHRRVVRPAALVRGRQGEVGRGDPGRGLAGRGKTIVELGFPRDATVVAVLRNDRVIVPRGDTCCAPATRSSCSSPPTPKTRSSSC